MRQGLDWQRCVWKACQGTEKKKKHEARAILLEEKVHEGVKVIERENND